MLNLGKTMAVLKTESAHLDHPLLLHASTAVLNGVSADTADFLEGMKVETVFDLSQNRSFKDAFKPR